MPGYTVTWEIHIFDAATAREASRRAFDIVREQHTTATVFTVIEHDGSGESVTVDLLEECDD